MYLLYIFPPRVPHTYDFVVLTSLTHPRTILLVVLETKLNSVAVVSKQNIPTERSPLVGEVSSNFCG
jgi:hypothetical protein